MKISSLADLIAAIHLVYVVIVVFGLFLILLGGVLKWRFIRSFWFRAIHLAMILLVVFEALFGITCPLTDWEYELRVSAEQDVTNESFIARLIHKLIFFDFPSIVFTAAYCLFGMLILLTWWRVPPHLPWSKPNPNLR